MAIDLNPFDAYSITNPLFSWNSVNSFLKTGLPIIGNQNSNSNNGGNGSNTPTGFFKNIFSGLASSTGLSPTTLMIIIGIVAIVIILVVLKVMV